MVKAKSFVGYMCMCVCECEREKEREIRVCVGGCVLVTNSLAFVCVCV